MSLLDKLLDKAKDSVNDEEKQKEWVEKGFDKALDEARDLLPSAGETDNELKSLRETGEFALNKIAKHKDALVGLGQHGLRSTVSLVGLGRYDDAAKHAALVKLRKTASWDEVSAAIIATAEDGNQAKRELDAEIAELKAALKDIGVTAAKAIIPLLIALA